MEEDDISTAIQTYKLQLFHVDQAILAAGPTPDLEALKTDLEELIKLSEDSLLSLKKSQLLKQLDVADNEGNSTSDLQQGSKSGHEQGLQGDQSGVGDHLDDEYAAFQAMLGDDISSMDSGKLVSPRADNSTSANISMIDDSIRSSMGDNCLQRSSAENFLRSSRADNYLSLSNTNNSFLPSRADNSPTSSRDASCDTNICDIQTVSDMYKEILGTKCRAPYEHEWGRKSYGNALIAGVENDSELEIPKVRVMFCNPTHAAMLPCKYHLGGSCRFTEEDCRYSHGHVVSLEDIQEYKDPDFSLLKLESLCLARFHDDDVWYEATVVDLHDNGVSVTFDDYNDEPVCLPFEDIFPVGNNSEVSDDEITDIQPIGSQDSDDDDSDDELPVFLWKPPSHGLGDLGQWEAHTKGIGSKLLTKMGYVPGQGLGKSGEGRIQPVPIQLLPQGKSLDKIMVLKELAGNRDMFDVMEKLDKKMKKQADKLEKEYNKTKQPPNVFDFINKKLHGKKGKLSELIHKHEGQGHTGSHSGQGHSKMHRTISEQDLNSKSDRNINIQLLKTSEEIKSVHKQLVKLKESLSRNENRDKHMASQVRQKIESLDAYLARLKSSESTMENHKQKRSNHKKLTVF